MDINARGLGKIFLTLGKELGSPLNGPKGGVKGEGDAPKHSLSKYPPDTDLSGGYSPGSVKHKVRETRPARYFCCRWPAGHHP